MIVKNDHEQVFVMQVFALLVQELLVSQLVQELLVSQLEQVQLELQLVMLLLVLPQLLVLVVFRRVVRLQLVHLLKKSKKKMNPKNLGYMF